MNSDTQIPPLADPILVPVTVTLLVPFQPTDISGPEEGKQIALEMIQDEGVSIGGVKVQVQRGDSLVERPQVTLPDYPALPLGFDRWVYRGIKYASPHAIMVTSIDTTKDGDWDEPMMFQTTGDDDTHYAEAVIDHHYVCECEECLAAK